MISSVSVVGRRLCGKLMWPPAEKSILVRGNVVICVPKVGEQENYRFMLQGAGNVARLVMIMMHSKSAFWYLAV